MAFRFLLGFRREDMGGTSVETVDPSVEESPVSEVPGSSALAEIPVSTELMPTPLTEVSESPLSIAPQAVESESPAMQAAATKSEHATAASAPARALDPDAAATATSADNSVHATPQAQVEVTAELVAEHTRADSTDWALEEKLA